MPIQTLPIGRLVYGHPSKLIQKTDTKRQPVTKADGTPVMVRQFGVAYDKATFNAQIWPIMYAAASGAFGGQQPPPHFSYKFKDGDGVDRQGKPYNQRTGYAGHCVVHFETQFDLIAYRQNPQTGGWDQITENDYKTGDYIAVNCSIEGNKPTDPTHTPGLFINPQGVLHMGNGDAIVNAPSADQMFGGAALGALPPGALPPGSAPSIPAGAPTPPGFAGAMPPAAAPGYNAPALAGYPAPGAPPAAPAAPAQPVYQPAPQPGPAPVYQPAPAAPAVPGAPAYPPAHDFVAAATGQPVPGQAPQAPGYGAPVPGAQPAYPMPPGGQPPR